jgi:hypothetical protein
MDTSKYVSIPRELLTRLALEIIHTHDMCDDHSEGISISAVLEMYRERDPDIPPAYIAVLELALASGIDWVSE